MNSEVEIFGMTDDLYYIRHGKNYGFLPKNHLREKARGNYPFEVEIDLSTRRIDQQVREQNFLFEFLKSSQPQIAEVTINEKVDVLAINGTEPSQENAASANEKPQEISVDALVDVKTEEKSGQPQAAIENNESDNDSGIEEDDDEEEDDEEGTDEESEEDSVSVDNQLDEETEDKQPELVAIPPSKDTDTPEIFNEVPKEPLALPVAASFTEEIQQDVNNFENSTVEEPPAPIENVPEFAPIKENITEQTGNILQAQNETKKTSPDVVEASKVVEDVVMIPPTPGLESSKTEEQVTQSTPPAVEEPIAAEKAPEPEIVKKEPAPVKEEISELPLDNNHVQEKVVVSEVPVAAEIIPATTEKAPEAQTFDQATTPPPDIQIPVATDVPAVIKTPKEAVEISQPVVLVADPTPLPVQKKPTEPDALLKRFNEKLGHRIVEGTGKGSVEALHKPKDHHRHHEHDHSHHGHEHHENHIHEEKLPDDNIEKSLEEPQVQEEEKPGFFAGLFKSFFSDKDDSEQHFHETAEKVESENIFTPTTENSGELDMNFPFLILK